MSRDKIYRLHLRVMGTERSRNLEYEEIYEMFIPTWIPNERKNIFTHEEYVSQTINFASYEAGDFMITANVESTVPADGDDINDGFSAYWRDHDDSVVWKFEKNLIEGYLDYLYANHSIPSDDVFEAAAYILQISPPHIFGWGNADPADAVEEISIMISDRYYEDQDV